MAACVPLKVKPVHVTVFAFPLFLSANVHVPDAVTVSPLFGVASPITHSALVPPSYVLLLHYVILGVKLI